MLESYKPLNRSRVTGPRGGCGRYHDRAHTRLPRATTTLHTTSTPNPTRPQPQTLHPRGPPNPQPYHKPLLPCKRTLNPLWNLKPMRLRASLGSCAYAAFACRNASLQYDNRPYSMMMGPTVCARALQPTPTPSAKRGRWLGSLQDAWDLEDLGLRRLGGLSDEGGWRGPQGGGGRR